MSTNLDSLDPESPEYEAAIDAAQAAEDEANGNPEPTPEEEGEPAAETTSEAQAAVAEDTPADEPTQPAAKVAGVANKDGTKVLPYAALQAERRAARHVRPVANA